MNRPLPMFHSSNVKLQTELKEINKSLKHLEKKQKTIFRNQKLVCSSCNKGFPIRKWTLLREYYYVEPYSCMGGDYWTFSNYYLYCNNCDSFHRIFESTYDKERKSPESKMFNFIKKFEFYFGEKLDFYGDREAGTITQIRALERNKNKAHLR